MLRENIYQGPKAALVAGYGNAGMFYPLAHQSQAKDMVRNRKLGAERPLGLINNCLFWEMLVITGEAAWTG